MENQSALKEKKKCIYVCTTHQEDELFKIMKTPILDPSTRVLYHFGTDEEEAGDPEIVARLAEYRKYVGDEFADEAALVMTW